MPHGTHRLPIVTESAVVTEGGPIVQTKAPTLDAAKDTERRRFMRFVGLGAFSVVFLPWRWAHAKKVGLALSQVPALKKVGGFSFVKVKGQELLLIRDAASSVRALDPMCTHKKCKVFYRPKSNDIGCKCHKSKFTLDGEPVSGPAPKPLMNFAAKLKGEQIIIKLEG